MVEAAYRVGNIGDAVIILEIRVSILTRGLVVGYNNMWQNDE